MVLRRGGAERRIASFATVVSFAGDNLRQAVIESSGPAGATVQVLQEAQRQMGLEEAAPAEDGPARRLGRAAARCWALLLTRIYECLPLQCPHCGQPMRIIAFVLDPPVIERILRHVGEPTEPPAILPARSPPQGEIAFDQDQDGGRDDWPDMDQSADTADASWD